MKPANLEEILAWHEEECNRILDYCEDTKGKLPQGAREGLQTLIDLRLQFIAGLKLAIAERVPKVTVKYVVQE